MINGGPQDVNHRALGDNSITECQEEIIILMRKSLRNINVMKSLTMCTRLIILQAVASLVLWLFMDIASGLEKNLEWVGGISGRVPCRD